MRQFYNTFGILHALRGELSWTHYRLLLKVERDTIRTFYIDEAIKCNWSTRTLERKINSFYFERILIDLKRGRLSHQDVGQMDMYVRYFDDLMRQESDGPTIGLILFTEENRTVAKYSLLNNSKHLFASEYMTCLPTKEELQKVIGNEIEIVEREKGLSAVADQKSGGVVEGS